MDSTRERDALVPDSFRDVQWTHLPGGETSPAFVARIAALLGATTSASTARGSGPALVSAPPARTRNLRAVWIPLGLAALFVGGGWFALQRSALHRHAEAGVTVQSQPAVTEKSIAVLPFSDLSEKHDQQYFADGMAEEIIDLLSSVPGLRVIGRTSSFQFKGKNQDLRAIGSDLGVSYVVEGRACGADLQLARPPFKSAEAYDLYLRGRHAYDRFDKQGLESAAAYFQQALELEPTSSLAAEFLAAAQDDLAEQGYVEPHEGFERARQSAQLTLRLDPKSSNAHATLSAVHLVYDSDWAGAEREAKEALRLHDSQILGAAVDQCRLGPPQRVRTVRSWTESDGLHPSTNDSCVLAGGQVRRLAQAAGEKVIIRP